jgi:hypothetical protein
MPEMKSLRLNDKTYDSFVDRTAREMASASFVVKSASGESITISDSGDRRLFGLSVYGKTTQDDVPTPDAPVELVSVGASGSITVNVTGENATQSMTIATPNGLPGIPITDGGNYTDSNGQQWICDEIDLARGVYVQRIGSVEPSATVLASYTGSHGMMVATLKTDAASAANNQVIAPILCSHFAPVGAEPQYASIVNSIAIDTKGQLKICVSGLTTKEAVTQWLADNKPSILYPLVNPIEIPLSSEVIDAYAALHTYKDHTTVSNDASAHMKVEYALDAKKYIDSLVGSSAELLEATVE